MQVNCNDDLRKPCNADFTAPAFPHPHSPAEVRVTCARRQPSDWIVDDTAVKMSFLRKDAGESLLSGWFNMQLCNHEAVALILDGADQEGRMGGCRVRVWCPSSLPFQAEKSGPAVVKLPLMLLKTSMIDSPPNSPKNENKDLESFAIQLLVLQKQ